MTLSCWCDYDACEWETNRWVKARKHHRCEECGRNIQPGEQYLYSAAKQDGSVWQSKCCEHCDELWGNLTNLGFCRYTGGVLFEALLEFYSDGTYTPGEWDEERDEVVLSNGRTPWEQVERLKAISRAGPGTAP